MTACSFCGKPRAEVGRLYRSKIGGMPPLICDHCIRALAADLDSAESYDVAIAELRRRHLENNPPSGQ